ncbi:crotonobetainyl-CoA:carnitine CoA-transferase CaiB-like acyl-CoA transferase [Aminobacter aminovorans]|uniref:Formyl-coenzyme A transferase n=1 Tax=Aminobacter aminovorans TaxID=83263 RepID=A0A381ILT9_AMIAI|nr:CoA transferase [Aminobacter aminovorans]TCS25052.1 crotonobetainyl-CoA:carnitine CoA-transferase CaiB-like acyl-CoA transferase [Aminobacter aminovorans]SUY28468.1 Formyl-coenzyme A transferase [Aminobacter aminovorans]
MTSDPARPYLPLAGLTVLELSGRPELATCGSLLASLGAQVYVVEDDLAYPGRSRRVAGKIPIRCEDDHIPRIASESDVILSSPDVEPMTIAVPETAILCDITAYGATGPLAGRTDSEALVQAVAGVADTTGRPDGAPCLSGAPFVGMETAVYAASAILAAIRHRDTSGRGQRIDMALYDVAVNALLTFLPLVFTGRPASRAGNRHPTLAPWNAYRGQDGWVLICAPTNDQWQRLCEVMRQPELAFKPAFATTTARFENSAKLDRVIAEWTGRHDVAGIVNLVGAAGIPCGPIHSLESLLSDPNLLHRDTLVQAEDGALLVRNPIRAIGHAAPSVGKVLAPGGATSAASVPPIDPRTPALSDIRIIEIGMNTVAPLACRQLGALGAEVIKVEPPTGDSNRANTPLRAGDGQSYVFALSNTDKRGIVLDLRQPEDAAILWRLIDSADVVIENLKPGSLARLGFGAKAIRTRKPSIVHCSVSGFGQDSAWPGRPALDTVVQALSGAMAATTVDGMPTKIGISISDQLGGQFGLLGILAALRHRDRTGEGVAMDIAMQDCTVWATQAAFDSGPSTTRILPCRDGWIAAESVIDVSAMGRDEALKLCSKRGIPAAPVLTVSEVEAASQTAARGLLVDVPTHDGSSWKVLGSPLKLMSTPARTKLAMPRLDWVDPGLRSELNLAPVRAEV